MLRSKADELRLSRAFTDSPPISSRLPFPYHRIPAALRTMIARAIGARLRRRKDRWAQFPGWPIDLSADILADWGGEVDGRISMSGRTPVVLTHDLDSPEGIANAVGHFLPLEEEVGARSTHFIVPCAWPLDLGLLGELESRGHELGLHGYDHANRTPFATEVERRARLDAAHPLMEQFQMRGYRAPSLLRTRALLDDLSARFAYDSSIPTSGGPFPVPNNGCASARPFRIGGLTELPLSMPRDGSLLFMGYSPEEIFRLWWDCAELIAKSGGVVVLLTHCEERFSGNTAMLGVYRRFLGRLSESGRYVFVTAQDIAAGAFKSS